MNISRDAALNAPVALPPIHLPRWLVNRLGIGEYSRSHESEIVSGILIHHLSASVAEPADEIAAALSTITPVVEQEAIPA